MTTTPPTETGLVKLYKNEGNYNAGSGLLMRAGSKMKGPFDSTAKKACDGHDTVPGRQSMECIPVLAPSVSASTGMGVAQVDDELVDNSQDELVSAVAEECQSSLQCRSTPWLATARMTMEARKKTTMKSLKRSKSTRQLGRLRSRCQILYDGEIEADPKRRAVARCADVALELPLHTDRRPSSDRVSMARRDQETIVLPICSSGRRETAPV